MVQSVLGSLILGYRPLWNRARKLAGIQLYAHNEASATVDGGHLLRTLLFGVTPADPLTHGSIVAALLMIAMLACWLPARRASRVSPIEGLRGMP